MNFIKKDKYRHKIIEHLLNQYGEINQNQNMTNFIQKTNNKFKQSQNLQYLDDMSQIDNLNNQGYNMYQKVISKQKALINDDEDNKQSNKIKQQSIINKINNNNDNYLKIKTKIKNNQNDQNYSKTLNLITNDILHELKRHQGKQAYVYHQNNPILTNKNKFIQKENDSDKIKIKTKNSFISKSEQNYQNQVNNIKEIKENIKNQKNYKKYRFINQNKVNQALQSKNKMKLIQYMNDNKEFTQQTDNIQLKQNQMIVSNQTHRSKGSQQMMQFLQSARSKLFLSKNNNEFMFDQQIQPINYQNIIQMADSKNNRNQILYQKFQIQIEISPNKNKTIQLTQNSNPNLIAKQFILQNKQQLQRKGFFNKKMQQILSQRIQIQIQQHKKSIIQSKQKDLQQKYQKIIEQIGERDNLLKEDKQNIQEQKTTTKRQNNLKSNKQTMRKKYKKQSFSHVYVENIESVPYEEQVQILRQQQQGESNNLQQKDQQYNKFKQVEKHQSNIVLDGYFNSPHELITYRQKCIENEEEVRSTQRLINQFKNQDELSYEHFPISKCTAQFKSLHKNLQNIQGDNQQNIGASKILSKSRQKRKLIAINSQIQQIQNVKMTQSLSNLIYQPNKNNYQKIQVKIIQQNKIVKSINAISDKIVKSIGKQNILNGVKLRQQQKRQKILQYKQLQQLKELEQCSFKPKINKLSQSIQKNKKKMKIAALMSMSQSQANLHPNENNEDNIETQKSYFHPLKKLKESKRYDDLYKNHKVIQAKKQYIRRKSIQQIPFRPDINIISNKIMATKRNSLNNSMCQYESSHPSRQQSKSKSRERFNILGNSHQHCIADQILKTIHKKRKSMQFQRNRQGLQIGDYLYKEAMRLKNKRDSTPQTFFQNFKPLEKSQKIINQTKQKRLSQLFNELVNNNQQQRQKENYQKVLCYTDINLLEQRFYLAPFKYLVPLLQELKQLQVSLTRQEFIESGIKLISYLSQEQRSQILLKKYPTKIQQEQNKENIMTMNKFSKKLVQKKSIYEQDIYHRGLVYKKGIKDKLQNNMENKVRIELQNCTFKPKINSNFQMNQ